MGGEEDAWRLLRGLDGVQDEYVLDAMEGGARGRGRGVLLDWRRSARWASAAAACLLVAIAAHGLPGVVGGGDATPDDGLTVANPMQEFGSLGELEEATGFGLQAPHAEAPYDAVSYVLTDGDVAEVDYLDDAGDGYAIRKAPSDAADSGAGIGSDLTEYAYHGTVRAALADGEIEVDVRGESEDALRVAAWSRTGYDYAIVADAEAPALTRSGVLEAVRATR